MDPVVGFQRGGGDNVADSGAVWARRFQVVALLCVGAVAVGLVAGVLSALTYSGASAVMRVQQLHVGADVIMGLLLVLAALLLLLPETWTEAPPTRRPQALLATALVAAVVGFFGLLELFVLILRSADIDPTMSRPAALAGSLGSPLVSSIVAGGAAWFAWSAYRDAIRS